MPATQLAQMLQDILTPAKRKTYRNVTGRLRELKFGVRRQTSLFERSQVDRSTENREISSPSNAQRRCIPESGGESSKNASPPIRNADSDLTCSLNDAASSPKQLFSGRDAVSSDRQFLAGVSQNRAPTSKQDFPQDAPQEPPSLHRFTRHDAASSHGHPGFPCRNRESFPEQGICDNDTLHSSGHPLPWHDAESSRHDAASSQHDAASSRHDAASSHGLDRPVPMDVHCGPVLDPGSMRDDRSNVFADAVLSPRAHATKRKHE